MPNQSIEHWIAKMYVFFISFRMLSVLSPIVSVFGMQAECFSFIFHFWGLFLLLLRWNGKIMISNRNGSGRLLRYFWHMIFFFSMISFVMATYVFFTYGRYNGKSPYVAVIKLLLDFVQYALIIVYSREVFLLLGKKEVYKWLLYSSRANLIIGYLQIAQLFGFPVLSNICQFFSDLFSFRRYPAQISLTHYEPSWAGMFIGSVVIPLHMSRLIIKKDLPGAVWFELLLWAPVILMTKSSTAYILSFTAFCLALMRWINANTKKTGTTYSAFILLIIAVVFLNTVEYLDELLGFNYSYLFRTKVLDLSNQSTASRLLPLLGNWRIFLMFPVFGCGNGLQGYFFSSVVSTREFGDVHFISSIYRIINNSSASIPNGQLFIPAILSGYGAVGLSVFLGFIYRSWKTARRRVVDFGIFGEIYLIALIPILIASFKSEFVGIYYIWFILSIPYSADTA